jgi:hypothetical protein
MATLEVDGAVSFLSILKVGATPFSITTISITIISITTLSIMTISIKHST